MRVLILAHARSGSTTFAKWLSKELKYKLVLEPYNTEVKKEIPTNVDCVVKELYTHLINNQINIDEFKNSFDCVIGLVRENIEDTCISLMHCNKVKKHHSPYVISENDLLNYKNNITLYYDNISNEIKEIINNCDILVKYENLYIDKNDTQRVKDFLKIEELNHLAMLDYNNRYRKSERYLI